MAQTSPLSIASATTERPGAPVSPLRPGAEVQPRAADTGHLTLLGTPPKVRKGGGGVPLVESLVSSLHSLTANATRTILTMLGIIIGVGAVIALLAYGNGVVAKSLAALQRNGTNLITLKGASQNAVGNVPTGNQSLTLTISDANALSDPGNCADCAAISPEMGRGGPIAVGNKRTFGELLGVWPSFTDAHSYNPVKGGFITDADLTSNANVVVLGANVAQSLFADTDPTGQTVRLNNISFKVVGVMEAKGGNGNGSLDNQVYLPLTTALGKLTGGRGSATTNTAGKIVETIYVKASSPE